MDEHTSLIVVGLPADFDLSSQDVEALEIDIALAAEPPARTLHEAETRVWTHHVSATEEKTAYAFYLLFVVLQFGMSRGARQSFNENWSGTQNGKPARAPLPEDLTDTHVQALAQMLATITTPAVRARVAHVLWHRQRPRDKAHATAAIEAYLDVAVAAFRPDSWVESEMHLARAYQLATALGKRSAERSRVVKVALDIVERLKPFEPERYTERIASRVHEALSQPQLEQLYEHVKGIAQRLAAKGNTELDFDWARAYYDTAIKMGQRLQRFDETKALRLERAETFVTEGDFDRGEMRRASSLRLGLRALRQAGAARERLNLVAQLLDEAQELSVHEMARIGTPFSTEKTEQIIRDQLRGRDPIEALWLLASQDLLSKRETLRRFAEEQTKKTPLALLLRHRTMTTDGRHEGETPGSLGATGDYESAIEGAMRRFAAYDRIVKVYGSIEPAREQLLLEHEYTLDSILLAVAPRPFIPYGHERLWAKGIHAGLVGEHDVALHLLVPQLEHALREVLRRDREVVWTSSSTDVQNLIGLEAALFHPKTRAIFPEDLVFTAGAVLAERLGANLRNKVAHGMITDAESGGSDAVYVWWLCLHMLWGFGPPPPGEAPAAGGERGD
jgi:hypothetical protein